MKDRSIFRGILWILVAAVFVFMAGGGWYFSSEIISDAFEPKPDPYLVPLGDYELEEVTYTSDLGEFDAWHLPASGSTWIIHVHGKGATPAEPEVLFGDLQRAGYHQLSITYRNDDGQPVDETGYYQYGQTEWVEVEGAVQFALDNGASGIVLSGFSTGAAHIMAYLQRRASDPVIAVMFDSPNIDMGRTVDFAATQRELPVVGLPIPGALTSVAKFVTGLRIGVNWKALDYLDKADTLLRAPTLVHHGDADETVPVSVSRDLAQIAPAQVTYIEVPGAGHVDSFDVDFEGYVEEVLTFLERIAPL